MALGDNPKVTRKRFTKAFEAGLIQWQLRQTPIGEQWRLQRQRRKHPAFRNRRRVHPAYRRVFVYYGTLAASNYGRLVRDDEGDIMWLKTGKHTKTMT